MIVPTLFKILCLVHIGFGIMQQVHQFNCGELQEYDYVEHVQTVRISVPVSLTSETLLNVTIIDFSWICNYAAWCTNLSSRSILYLKPKKTPHLQ